MLGGLTATTGLAAEQHVTAVVPGHQVHERLPSRHGGAPAVDRGVMARRPPAAPGVMSPGGPSRGPVAARPPCFAAPVALGAPCSRRAPWSTGAVERQDQEAVSRRVVAARLAGASGETTRRCTALRHRERGATSARLRHGGVVGTGLHAPGLGAGGSRPQARREVPDGLTTAHHPDKAREPRVRGRGAHTVLLAVTRCASWGHASAVGHAIPEPCDRCDRRVTVHLCSSTEGGHRGIPPTHRCITPGSRPRHGDVLKC